MVTLLLENKADVTHSFDEGGNGGRRLTAYELAERAGHTKAGGRFWDRFRFLPMLFWVFVEFRKFSFFFELL